MTFTLTIETGNAAFEESRSAELARILTEVAYKVSSGQTDGTVLDINGNTVGKFTTGE